MIVALWLVACGLRLAFFVGGWRGCRASLNDGNRNGCGCQNSNPPKLQQAICIGEGSRLMGARIPTSLSGAWLPGCPASIYSFHFIDQDWQLREQEKTVKGSQCFVLHKWPLDASHLKAPVLFQQGYLGRVGLPKKQNRTTRMWSTAHAMDTETRAQSECRVQSAECKRKRKEKEKEKRADDVSPALSESLSVSYPMGTPCERHTNARTVSGCSPPKIAENMINLIM